MLQPWRLLFHYIFLWVLLESLGTWPGGHVCRSTWRARKYVATWPWPFEGWNFGRSGRDGCEAHFQELEHLVESNSWIFRLERRNTRLVGEHGNSFSWWSRKMEISRHGDCMAILVGCSQRGGAQRLGEGLVRWNQRFMEQGQKVYVYMHPSPQIQLCNLDTVLCIHWNMYYSIDWHITNYITFPKNCTTLYSLCISIAILGGWKSALEVADDLRDSGGLATAATAKSRGFTRCGLHGCCVRLQQSVGANRRGSGSLEGWQSRI